ncbi:M23 family metallopeptidase [Bordetella genomosp. 13]|uniref:Metallopeptidase n=1 Tax=Bordetella genomosp. 13 TaxID=463040 RepID=A0A1W6ZGQ2_9BORD|nr:peptidoglycan DD-metalloendopeptidase family protein [Bordetella genomosp. 13]ARP96583.1 metallopeptidase [Bordetella genomosp. 13]
MNRGLDCLVRSIRHKVAVLIAPPKQTVSRGGALIRRTLVVTALGLFAGAAALGMVQQPDHTELPPLRLVNSPMPLSAEQMQVSTATDAPYINETRIRRGDTLATVLQRLDIDNPRLQSFLTHDASARSIYKLYPGRSVQAAVDEAGNLQWLRYIHTPGAEDDGQVSTRMLYVESDGADGYTAREVTEGTRLETRVAVGTIRSSLFAATDAAGVPDSITLQIAEILGSKMDFLRDLRQGDQFRVVYETRSHDGRYAGAGRVLAVEFVNGSKTYNAVWFNPDGKSGAYYDFEGTNLRGAFLRTALKFTRISSTFGMRMHPIHKTWTGHKGVDYAAPTGTPIHSTADGTVEFAGWQNGYGNVVIVKHHGQYSTLYGHQSRLAEGIRKGATVSQGQLIGYVGSTGWATGPHLHYEFRVDNRPVDPLSVDLPVARTLEANERKAFADAVAPYRAQIEMLTALQQTPPEGSTTVAAR